MFSNAKVDELNDIFFRESSEEASKYLKDTKNLELITNYFHQFESYSQAAIIFSVIYLKDDEFNVIADRYMKIIDTAKNSPDEWVRRFANIFATYPNINVPTDYSNIGENCKDESVKDPFAYIPSVEFVSNISFSMKRPPGPPSNIYRIQGYNKDSTPQMKVKIPDEIKNINSDTSNRTITNREQGLYNYFLHKKAEK